jgi:hypothetical protein
MQFPQPDVVFAHQNNRLLVQGMDRYGLDRGHFQAGAREQLFLSVVEQNSVGALNAHQQAGDEFLGPVDG